MGAFSVVSQFEHEVARFAGSKFAVAVNTGTSALFLSLVYCISRDGHLQNTVTLPARTFISVPMAVLHAGGKVAFDDYKWSGTYKLEPFDIVDGALRFRKEMYKGGLHCLSFHARKILNIGEGGMVLTDDIDAWTWLQMARYSGRTAPRYRIEDVAFAGWQCYMTPEKAARGLHLMEYVEDEPDQVVEYPDLRKAKVFQ
jgi:dTDP-4-amino-4,6-dideoxygalactose transaminase